MEKAMLIEKEIKEILDILKTDMIHIRLFKEDRKKLLDYITNLQECCIDKIDRYQEMILKCCELKEENERLNNVINELEYWIRMNDRKDIEGNRVIYVEKLLKELKKLKEGK